MLNACALPGENFTSDGKAGHKIHCSGSTNDWDMCYNKANEICGETGYEVLQKLEDHGAFAAYQSASLLPDCRLMIQCKK